MNQNKAWSVYDTVTTTPSTPENLMADINSAISALESSRSITSLEPKNKNPQAPVSKPKPQINKNYDAKLADESYKAGLACLASGKLDEAVESLNTSLLNCPPHQTSAVAKLRSLISVTSQQLHSAPNEVLVDGGAVTYVADARLSDYKDGSEEVVGSAIYVLINGQEPKGLFVYTYSVIPGNGADAECWSKPAMNTIKINVDA
ncbi:hypothetical protein POM88_005618 [Heracleum sosnowskyi]|uniref:Uncharacterized protein n=1 Tax=Heracleum sosnowskyi TaxID=360622 RepID=A0AAD8J4S3_9APIA|nr:hypothetical protein POM88_005618 [Heracleum sosnowskyi]